jgi:cytochrome c oxidase assembly factor CtaG
MSHPAPVLTTSEPAAVLAGLDAWNLEPAVLAPLAVAAGVYLVGWAVLARRMPERFGAARAAAFLGGLAALAVAVCSPVDALATHLLQAHMIQHLLLMVVAPPLLWLGAPVAPLLLGLPRPARRAIAAGLAARPLRPLLRALGDPRAAWLLFIAAFWLWHVPALYELALRSDVWHHVEHACFFATALGFWRPVISAWPARRAWPEWAMILFLLLVEAQNTLLSAILTFSDRVIYPFYGASGRPGGLSALEDQALAGVIMWVPGSLAFALPVLWLLISMLTSPSSSGAAAAAGSRRAGERPAASTP